MPKELPPEQGFNVKEELDKIRANPSAFMSAMKGRVISNPFEQDEEFGMQLNFAAAEMTASDLMNRINTDVCCNSRQLSIIHEELYTLIKERDKVLEVLQSVQEGDNGAPRKATRHLWRHYKLRLSTLTSEINSYRLACLNCLHDDSCEKRNPKHPLIEVQKRGRKIFLPNSK